MSGFFGFLTFLAFVAFVVGLIKPKLVVFWSKNKTRGKAWLYVPLGIIFIIIAAASSGGGSKTTGATQSNGAAVSTTSTTSKVASKASTPSKASTISVNQTLTSGYYTVGIDIPTGTYNFTATNGSGNVTTNDGSLNEVMGTAAANAAIGTSMYTPTYSNADLSNGTVLSVSSVTIQIVSSNASGTPLKPRNQTITKVVQFSDGNYVSGKDFPAGTYNLAAVSGSGNVTDDATDMLNAIMGTGNDAMYEKTYQNVDFPAGTKLTISGVTISLTPSK